MTPNDLLVRWRTEAEVLRANAAEAQASVKERDAEDLERWLRDWWAEPLTVEDAVAESGYSRDSLLRFLREGKVDNIGTIDDPRIERSQLPRKPGHRAELPWDSVPSLARKRPRRASSVSQVVRAAVSGE